MNLIGHKFIVMVLCLINWLW